MRAFHLVLVLLLLTIFSFGQRIRSEEDVNIIKSQIDNHNNLKLSVMSPKLFNSKGETYPSKFSYNFLYDVSNNSLVKIDIINSENSDIQSFYFSNDQLVLVYSKEETEYFFDSDFDIPYWGNIITKLTIKRDKFKETAYRLLISFKRFSKKNFETQK